MESGKLVCTRKLYKIMMVYFNNVRPLKKNFILLLVTELIFCCALFFWRHFFRIVAFGGSSSIVARAIIVKIYGKILNFTTICHIFGV